MHVLRALSHFSETSSCTSARLIRRNHSWNDWHLDPFLRCREDRPKQDIRSNLDRLPRQTRPFLPSFESKCCE